MLGNLVRETEAIGQCPSAAAEALGGASLAMDGMDCMGLLEYCGLNFSWNSSSFLKSNAIHGHASD